MIRALALALLVLPAWAGERNKAVRAEFMRAHPCPATGKPHGPCPGWVVDHVTPLCAAGRDAPDNLAWQTTADAKAKDREEIRLCRALRQGSFSP